MRGSAIVVEASTEVSEEREVPRRVMPRWTRQCRLFRVPSSRLKANIAGTCNILSEESITRREKPGAKIIAGFIALNSPMRRVPRLRRQMRGHLFETGQRQLAQPLDPAEIGRSMLRPYKEGADA